MKQSAGILLYRKVKANAEFFLVHPGGPFFKNKNEGWWTIPKGEPQAEEELIITAQREFTEETGYTPHGPFIQLMPITQKGGKKVHAWACEGDINADALTSNYFEMEWPPKSGRKQSFPEVDKAGWFDFEQASRLVNQMQKDFLVQLLQVLA